MVVRCPLTYTISAYQSNEFDSYVKKAWQWFSLGTSASSTNKTGEDI
jgi:hypothetical protein